MSQEAKMKQRLLMVVMVLAVAALCVSPVFAQATGSVKAVVRIWMEIPSPAQISNGSTPITAENTTLRPTTRANTFPLASSPASTRSFSKDGKQLDQVSDFPVALEETTLDFDLKKSQAESAQQKGISAEQLKAMQEAQAKNAKEVNTVKALNEKLAAANSPCSPEITRLR